MRTPRLSWPRAARPRISRRSGRNGVSPSPTPLEPRFLLAAYGSLARSEAAAWYRDVFKPLAQVPAGWNGNVNAGNPGTLDPAYQNATLGRINAYRYMAGLPGVSLDATKSALAQAAALLMSSNNDLSHNPPSTWINYTQAGFEGASKSNLSLGVSGSGAIDLYMNEAAPAGHRRWLLYPPTTTIGIGDVPTPDPAHRPTNATHVLTNGGARPASSFVAWPPAGYLPGSLKPQGWSFAVDSTADFSGAGVTVTRDGSVLPTTIVAGSTYGDPALEWRVDGATTESNGPDRTYEVAIKNVRVNGQSRDYSYLVTMFDPETVATTPESNFSLATTSATVGESGGYVDVVVNRTGDLTTTASVGYATIEGTATNRDFTSTSGRLTFTPGQNRATVRILVTADRVSEDREMFGLVIRSPLGAKISGASNASITITDDDPRIVKTAGFKANRVGRAMTSVVVRFDGPIDGAVVERLNAYSLAFSTRRKGQGAKTVDQAIALGGAVYDAALGEVTLRLARPYRPRQLLKLVVKSSVIDPTGSFFDGDGDGDVGGDAVWSFRS